MNQVIETILQENDLCVLATSDGDKPYCSLMAYAPSEDRREIYLVSHRNTKKYRNLLSNPSVSLLIDTRAQHPNLGLGHIRALTVNGAFAVIKDSAQKDRARAKIIERHPDLKVFASHPDAEVFSVRMESFLVLDGFEEASFEMAP